MTNWHFNTRAVHKGESPCPLTGALRTPIYQTSTFAFKDVEQGGNLFKGEDKGYIYTRLGNPTQTVLEEKMADLEEGEAACAAASGMAAVTSATLAFLNKGDHIISSRPLYGCTYSLFKDFFPRWGIEVSFVDLANIESIPKNIKENTRMIYFETPANPTMKLADLAKVAALGKSNNCITVVDNTFMTPYFQKPLTYGIDIVLHSATKYIGGHGDVIAGIIISNKDYIDEIKKGTLKDLGGVISPFDAWLLIRGLKTLPLRMERINNNAIEVAHFLASSPKIQEIYYPGLAQHPQHQLAKEQMTGFGGMISFELKGGFAAGKKLMNNLKLCTLAVSLGDAETLIQHPSSMTHSVVCEDDRLLAGISEGLVRLSVGIEDARDIISDLQQGLANL